MNNEPAPLHMILAAVIAGQSTICSALTYLDIPEDIKRKLALVAMKGHDLSEMLMKVGTKP